MTTSKEPLMERTELVDRIPVSSEPPTESSSGTANATARASDPLSSIHTPMDQNEAGVPEQPPPSYSPSPVATATITTGAPPPMMSSVTASSLPVLPSGPAHPSLPPTPSVPSFAKAGSSAALGNKCSLTSRSDSPSSKPSSSSTNGTVTTDPIPNPDLSEPPFAPTRVEVQVVLNDVGQVDLIAGTLELQLEISMNWRDPRIQSDSEQIADESIWRPKLNIFNRALDAVVGKPPLFFRNGICGYDLTYTGKVFFQPGDATAQFPFDTADVRMIIDGCDDYLHSGLLELRIVPDVSLHLETFGPQKGGQKAFKVNPQFKPEQLQEWTIKYLELKEFESHWSRTYQRLRLRLVMQRNPTYYFVKIVMVVTLINLLSILAFAMDPVRASSERLSFAATVLVATTAFLYVIHSDLPRTPHLHSLDKLMVISFAAQFLTGLVTAIEILVMRIKGTFDGILIEYSSATDSFWIVDLVFATALFVWIVAPLIFFWIPKTFFTEQKLTAKDLTLDCPSHLEPYGACIGAGYEEGLNDKDE